MKALIKAKREGFEKGDMPKELESGILETIIQDLYTKIVDAYLKSRIPEKPLPEDFDLLNSYLIRLRKDML